MERWEDPQKLMGLLTWSMQQNNRDPVSNKVEGKSRHLRLLSDLMYRPAFLHSMHAQRDIFWFLFETEFHYIGQDDLKLTEIQQSQLPRFWSKSLYHHTS